MERIVVVTGASRGVGRGIALGLAPGSTVYVTGRPDSERGEGFGSLAETARLVSERGGRAVVVACDHGDDAQTAALFDRVAAEQGRLDVLVNNATALPPAAQSDPFWDRPLEPELAPLRVGARSHYVATHHAAKLMVPQGSGLIVNVSSPGSRTLVRGLHGVTYGMDKAASDKFTFDAAYELSPHGVTMLSIWPGIVMTEFLSSLKDVAADFLADFAPAFESPEFIGRVVDALSRDSGLSSRAGKAWYVAALARELGVTEADGSAPPVLDEWMGEPIEYAVAAPTWAEFQRER